MPKTPAKAARPELYGQLMPKKPMDEQAWERRQRAAIDGAASQDLLDKYVQVIERQGDSLLIEPRSGFRLAVIHQVDGDNRRSLRILIGPIPPKR